MLNLVGPPKANGKPSREQLLQLELQKQSQQLSQLAGILCALLKEKHEGRAFLKPSALSEVANYQVNFQMLPELGTMRLQLVTPQGQPFVPPESPASDAAPIPVPKTAEVEAVAEPAPSAPCSSEWHKDGIGLRCPDCGSVERVSA